MLVINRARLLQGQVSANAFLRHGLDIIRTKSSKCKPRSEDIALRRFRSNFGTSPEICSNVYARILFQRKAYLPGNVAPKHLLWALHLMKTYDTENVIAGHCDTDEKTFRFWAWLMIAEMSRLASVEVSHDHISFQL